MVVANYQDIESRRYPRPALEQVVEEVLEYEEDDDAAYEEYLEIVYPCEEYDTGYNTGYHCWNEPESEEDDEEEEDYPEGYDYPDEPSTFDIVIIYPGQFQETAKSYDILPSTSFRDLVEDVMDLHEIDHDSKGYLIHCQEYPNFFNLDEEANFLTENVTLVCERIFEPVRKYGQNNVVGRMAAAVAA